MENEEFQSNLPEEESYREEILPEDEVLPEDDIADIDEHKMFAAMSYMGVLVLVSLFMKKDDPFVQFHAKQGLVILAGLVIAFMAMFWNAVISNVLFIVLLIASVIGLVQSLQGRRWKIPGIGDIADKFSL